jgi:hypothetical protein
MFTVMYTGAREGGEKDRIVCEQLRQRNVRKTRKVKEKNTGKK